MTNEYFVDKVKKRIIVVSTHFDYYEIFGEDYVSNFLTIEVLLVTLDQSYRRMI